MTTFRPTGAIATKIKLSKRILSRLNLLRDAKELTNYASQDIGHLRSLSHQKQWLYHFSNGYYDFVLNNYALIQFRYNSLDDFSLIHHECPFVEFIEYDDFLRDTSENDKHQEFLYDALIEELPASPTNNYLRYDYSPNLYNEGRHPAAHFHAGNTNLRIGTKQILNPLSFIYFVLRQFYPLQWLEFTNNRSNAQISSEVHSITNQINPRHYNSPDKLELYLA